CNAVGCAAAGCGAVGGGGGGGGAGGWGAPGWGGVGGAPGGGGAARRGRGGGRGAGGAGGGGAGAAGGGAAGGRGGGAGLGRGAGMWRGGLRRRPVRGSRVRGGCLWRQLRRMRCGSLRAGRAVCRQRGVAAVMRWQESNYNIRVPLTRNRALLFNTLSRGLCL